jgi:hypothetical protein
MRYLPESLLLLCLGLPAGAPGGQDEYNDCVLEYLVEVESFQAVMEIHSACSGKYLME